MSEEQQNTKSLFDIVKEEIKKKENTYTFEKDKEHNLLSWNTANKSHFCLVDLKDKKSIINQFSCYFNIDEKTQKGKILITYNFNNLSFENFSDYFLEPKFKDIDDNKGNHRCEIACISPDNDIENALNMVEKFKEILLKKKDQISNRIKQISPDLEALSELSPNVIFYGAPGTGKTHAVKDFLKKHGIDELPEKIDQTNKNKSYYKWVQFHPSFTYEDFIEGLKPTGVADKGSVKLELINGVFKDFCKQALNGIKEEKSPEKDIPYYFIADEINRANLSTVFGETLSLLEPSYRDKILDEKRTEIRNLIDTQYSALERKASDNSDLFYDSKFKGKFGIPRNVRFIGMMNDVDKSIDAFDLALRRRFRWIRKDCDFDVIEEILSEKNIDKIENYIESCRKLNTYISGGSNSKSLNLGKSYEFGHSFFMKITEFTTQTTISEAAKGALFDNYLRPTLKEYLRSEVNSEKNLEEKLKEARGVFVKNINKNGKNESAN